DQGVEGSFRFLNRAWRIVMDYLDDIEAVKSTGGGDTLEGELKNLRRKTHQTIRKVTRDIEDRFHFNTAISAVMELVNALYLIEKPAREDKIALSVIRETIETIIILLAPIVPHITAELWKALGYQGSLADVPWPAYDHDVAAEEEITIVIQVNGKVRSRMVVPVDEDGEKIKALALNDEKIISFIAGKKVMREIYVPKKLVNIVVQ
ncbi:MAG: class I tRNA ligase family protein, partial [Syntrophales bacterium]